MTTEEELDEILQRALHAAVESVEPAGDGLQQIRRQLDRPRYQLQLRLWLTESMDAIRLIGIRLEPATERARCAVVAAFAAALGWLRGKSGSSGQAAAAERPRQGAAHRSQPPGRFATLLSPTIAWLRPALAVGAAVVIVVAGVFGLAQLRQTVTDISLLTGGNPSAPSHQPSPSRTAKPGSPPVGVIIPLPLAPSPTPDKTRKATTHHHSSPAPTCTPHPSKSPGAVGGQGTAPPTPTSSASASASPTGSGAAAAAAGTGTSTSGQTAASTAPSSAAVNSPSKAATCS